MLLTKSLAQEVAHLRIRVNALSPGAIRTPRNVEKLTSPEVFERVLLKLIPAKSIGEPEDVARAAVWLASDESDYVNGVTIYIDGGMALSRFHRRRIIGAAIAWLTGSGALRYDAATGWPVGAA
jgi:glucose 1-dehydrogenase